MADALDDLADKFVEAVEKGELAAFKELGDRLDGKPAQSITVAGDADAPLQTEMTVKLVRPDAG